MNSVDGENIGGGMIIDKLVEHGANIRRKDRHGMLGIHLAAINGNCGIIQKLLDITRRVQEIVLNLKSYQNQRGASSFDFYKNYTFCPA